MPLHMCNLLFLDPEDWESKLLQHTGNYSPAGMASYLRR